MGEWASATLFECRAVPPQPTILPPHPFYDPAAASLSATLLTVTENPLLPPLHPPQHAWNDSHTPVLPARTSGLRQGREFELPGRSHNRAGHRRRRPRAFDHNGGYCVWQRQRRRQPHTDGTIKAEVVGVTANKTSAREPQPPPTPPPSETTTPGDEGGEKTTSLASTLE